MDKYIDVKGLNRIIHFLYREQNELIRDLKKDLWQDEGSNVIICLEKEKGCS